MARTPRGTTFHNQEPSVIPEDAPRAAALVEFANRLQAAMVEKGISQSDLTRKVSLLMGKELGRSSVSQYVRAKTLPSPIVLKALAQALGKQPAELLPTRGVRSAEKNAPPVDVRQTSDGGAWLHINQQVPWDKAVKILAILKDEAA